RKAKSLKTYSLYLKLQVVLLLYQSDQLFFQFLPLCLRLGELIFGFLELLLHGGHLLLGLCALQQGFDLEEELHPGPVLDIHEGADVVLDAEDGLPENKEWIGIVEHHLKSQLYLLCIIFWNSTRMRNPLHTACVRVISLAKRSSRISSRVPSKPALKNTCGRKDRPGSFIPRKLKKPAHGHISRE
ncbi:hypothetical protein LEMLEM_LOCUS26706, partial [Lemmus lemmus]